MSFEKIFKVQFDAAADKALSTGVRGAFVEGCTYGVASGLIYLAEALLFYVGAVLIARGLYTYLQMVEVLNLVVFSVTIGSQLMGFSAFFSSYLTCFECVGLIRCVLQRRKSPSLFRRPVICTSSSISLRTRTNRVVHSALHSPGPSRSRTCASRTLSDRKL